MKPFFRLTLLLLVSVLSFKSGSAQTCQWALSLGATYNTAIWPSLATDPGGNLFVSGSFDGSGLSIGTTMIFGGSSHRFFLCKYTATGSVVWSRGAVGYIDTFTYTATDKRGHVYIAGSFTDTAMNYTYTTLRNSGTATNVFLLKINGTSAAEVWAKSVGGTSEATGVAVDDSGNVYVSGYFSSPSVTFGATTLTNALAGKPDAFLAKYDSFGNVVWAKSSLGGTDEDKTTGVAVDASGNIYVSGVYRSPSITFGSVTLTNSSAGTMDMFLVKYDNNGNVIWARGAGGSNDDKAIGVVCDPSGNVFTAGYYKSSLISFGTGTLTNASAGTADMFVTKFDPLGSQLWARSAGGSGAEQAAALSADAYGNVYVSGTFLSPSVAFGATTLTSTGTMPYIFTAQYNSLGNVVWVKNPSIGTTYTPNNVTALASDPSANIYLAGNFASATITFDTSKLTKSAKYESDMFLVKYKGIAVPSSIPFVNADAGSLVVYPNPATTDITVRLPKQAEASSIEIFDMLGRQVYYSGQAHYFSAIQLRLPDLPSGVYLLHATGDHYEASVPLRVVR